MKKAYLKPVYRILDAEPITLICASDEIVSDKGINYGGVDNSGVKDPDARESLYDRRGGSDAWEEW